MTAGGYRGAVTGAVLVVVTASALGGAPLVTGGTGVVSADSVDENEAPLADAGLDQEVPVNTTVYLDASGSRDPDGSIETYEWSIERPDGHMMDPACEGCARTEFLVTQNGTYEVTVTVTDDDGATSSDTLYVKANHVEGPSIELSGPVTVSPRSNTTYTATATAGASPLMKIEWDLDDSEMADSGVGGESATDDLTVGLDSGTHRLTVRVVSEMGRTDTATLTINATDRPVPPCEGATWNETAGWWDVGPCEEDDGDDGDDESCYDAQSERAEDWEDQHPDKEFACYNDVWFGGQSPSIVDTNENNRFNAKGVKVSRRTAKEWAKHPDVSLTTDTGFNRLNFHTQEAWKNAKQGNDPTDEDPDESDDGGDSDDDDGGQETPCHKLPERIQDQLDRCN